MKPFDWQAGSPVECNFKGAGKWFPGRIAGIDGGRVQINDDDGDRETTNT